MKPFSCSSWRSSLLPFERLPFVPANGRGLHPLLYDDGMLIHPPVLLAGYVSAAIPFAFAIAALASGRLGNEWVLAARRWVLGGWAVLGSGLLLGGWWAYHVLGWGGYWGWDPVENVALLPWLTATALLHSLAVQERRGLLKVWNFSLVIATFALSIFGTFVVRSGVISSVHSFAQSAIGPFFFVFLGLVLVASLALLFVRLPRLASSATVETVYSREATFLANNWLLIGIAFATFWGTIFPLISETVRDVRVAVGAPFFNQVNGPLLLGLLVLMGIGPLVPWRGAGRATVWRNFRLPLLGGVVTAIAAGLIAGQTPSVATGTFGVVGFVIVGVVQEVWRATRGQQRAARGGLLAALLTVLRRHRRRYGGYLVHVSIAGLAVGVIGSTFFNLERQVTLQTRRNRDHRPVCADVSRYCHPARPRRADCHRRHGRRDTGRPATGRIGRRAPLLPGVGVGAGDTGCYSHGLPLVRRSLRGAGRLGRAAVAGHGRRPVRLAHG